MAEMFENLLNEMRDAEKNFPEDLKEADSLGKGPDKTPEMKGKGPDLANVNEEDGDMTGDEEVDAYGRPNFPNPSDEELAEDEEMAEGQHGNLRREVYDRLDGLVNQKYLETLKQTAMDIVTDFREGGEDFEPEDMAEFLKGHVDANVHAAYDNLQVGKEELPNKDECNEPPTLPMKR